MRLKQISGVVVLSTCFASYLLFEALKFTIPRILHRRDLSTSLTIAIASYLIVIGRCGWYGSLAKLLVQLPTAQLYDGRL